MSKKDRVTNKQIVAIGVLALFMFGIFIAIITSPSNNSDISRWAKTNFFPADEFGITSVLDVDSSQIPSQEYKGSTASAWMFCGILSIAALIIATLYLAKERHFI